MKVTTILIICLLIPITVHGIELSHNKYYYLELESQGFPAMQEIIKEIESYGLTVRHIVPINRIIPKGRESLLIIMIIPQRQNLSNYLDKVTQNKNFKYRKDITRPLAEQTHGSYVEPNGMIVYDPLREV